MQRTKRTIVSDQARDPRTSETLAAFAYLAAEFSLKASPEDFALLLGLLGEWCGHDDIEHWFHTCVMKTFGMPVFPIASQRVTLRKLHKQTMLKQPRDRAWFVAGHLDLVSADDYERAFLVAAQKIYREIGDMPGNRVGQLAPKLAEMAQLLLEDTLAAGAEVVHEQTKRKAKVPTVPRSRTRNTVDAAA